MAHDGKIEQQVKFQYQGRAEAPEAFLKTIPLFESWHQPLSTPSQFQQKIKSALAIALIASGAIGPVLIPSQEPEQVTESRWHQPWSEPVRFKSGLSSYLQQNPAWSTVTPTSETITVDKWIYPWTDPIRTRKLQVSQQQNPAWNSATPAPPPPAALTGAVPTNWNNPPSSIRRIIYQSFAKPVSFAAPEVITVDKWIYAWSEPVRAKPGLRSNLQQSVALVEAAPFTETVTESRWHQAWSEPVRFKPGIPAHQQQVLAWNTVVPAVVVTVFVPAPGGLDVVFPKTLIYQSVSFVEASPFTEIVTESRWHQPWSEPVRFKRGLASYEQQPLAWNPSTPTGALAFFVPAPADTGTTFPRSIIYQAVADATPFTIPFIDKWGYAWSEPVRQKLGLRAGLQQFFATDPTYVPNPSKLMDGWSYAWSEPVRQKAGLTTNLQQTTTPATPIYPILTKLIQWFSPLSEPVRQKIGLRAWLQRFFEPATTPLATVITITLNATETNTDTALFGIYVYNAIGAGKCVVSIKEIPATDSGAASIAET